ncbi:duf647 domain-containing protein [Stemphylium lycopersici]|nr:duf647 domain-containing protein [Stemphylium lycopersici]
MLHSGVGVGDSTATPTTALLLSVLQESTGRIATILFAHRLGTALEPECKMFRLAADIFNDTAMVLDCLSPGFPKPIRVAVLSFSSCLRALCGVCAGSAKASLSAHFAKKGNLGEVNATFSTLLDGSGRQAGSLVVSYVSSPLATWATLILLLSMHLGTNYAAVRAVSMHSLNRQRACILFSNLIQDGVVLSPHEVSARERIFEKTGVLRWSDGEVLGKCRIGVSLQELLGRIGTQHKQSGSVALRGLQTSDLLDIFITEAYVLWPATTADEALIVLKAGCGPIDQLRAWAHALLLAKRARSGDGSSGSKPDDGASPKAAKGDLNAELAELTRTLKDVRAMFERYGDVMREKGWDLGAAAMETKAGTRLQVSMTE